MPKLARALLCLDCESIYDQSLGINCPSCSSKTVWPIGKWVEPCVRNLNTGIVAELRNKTKEVV